ncbi:MULTISPECIES: pyruvate, water dikinase regulatory protein [unclassified Nocardioides]|uniref:pyruvate, water dikinase regulatory protein n=1 Tax=unclassified Nocardioides TaxID=2615069 RepID=UPI0006FACC39|nr:MULTISPECIES: pyruvate, phosphate dikinase/phosphoenolpyruvate synthase regulator [unclassified Nocardioides]KQY57547.1 phosphoenolpyruvate synthetase regulatory protein [Nocardioides sp. Root140]KQZ76084.1 phosphoenolpyruvate synthetase regulatory protein [Nocardioides sp. Root151]KRF20253.1 phosphoenolpyruvate synthetase regulatory protein [Nocardioides sp. Soil796]
MNDDDDGVVPVFFLSDSTGISAETMGNALLIQFPDLRFDRTVIPFISSVDEAREVVARLDQALDENDRTPLVFITAASDEVRLELQRTRCPVIDFFDMHMQAVESILQTRGTRLPARLHGLGDIKRYNSRMQAIEYTIEHDDGQSVRGLEKADVILLAPSRCGKTPTSMYLALQHGLFVANYPIVEDDFATIELPEPVRHLRERCFGMTTSPQRLAAVREERRPGSTYASLEQCTFELRRTTEMFARHRLPVVDSSTISVEEISTIILQRLKKDEVDAPELSRNRNTRTRSTR